MDQRPVEHLSHGGHWAIAIVRATQRITGSEYKVYELIVELDRGGRRGCFMSQEERARQCALGISTVQAADERLARLGLIVRARHGRSYDLYATLPLQMAAAPPLDACDTRARRKWVLWSAEALDRHIDAIERAGGQAPADPTPPGVGGQQAQRLGPRQPDTPKKAEQHPQVPGASLGKTLHKPCSSVTLKRSGTYECDTGQAAACTDAPYDASLGPDVVIDPRTGRLRLRRPGDPRATQAEARAVPADHDTPIESHKDASA